MRASSTRLRLRKVLRLRPACVTAHLIDPESTTCTLLDFFAQCEFSQPLPWHLPSGHDLLVITRSREGGETVSTQQLYRADQTAKNAVCGTSLEEGITPQAYRRHPEHSIRALTNPPQMTSWHKHKDKACCCRGKHGQHSGPAKSVLKTCGAH